MGVSNPAPKTGQAALDNSVQIKDTSPRRVGVDAANKEIVIFDDTHPGKGVYHDHTREWCELTDDIENALSGSGRTNRRGTLL